MRELVLMADIIGSSSYSGTDLSSIFYQLTDEVNKKYNGHIKSPLTITLGDEFQGVVSDISSSVDIILFYEEELIHNKLPFRLRYILNEGEIVSEVNTQIAHGMLGPGLTEARNLLLDAKKSNEHFYFHLENEQLSKKLNKAFYLYQHIQDSWNPKDLESVSLFLSGKSYREVARILDKDESSTWRREKSLGIRAYANCKELIRMIAND